jgi:Spy/CpxP family protein refolding chaperone
MKVLQAFVVAGFLMGSAAFAGVDKPAEPQLEPGLQRLKKQLSLTEQQTQEINKIFKETSAKREAIIKELRAVSKKRQEQMNAILTQEQREAYEQKSGEVEVPERSSGQPERSKP